MQGSVYLTQEMVDRFLKQEEVTRKKQDECRYCHPPYQKWDGGYWDEATWQINRYKDKYGLHYELLGIGYEPDNNKLVNLPTEIMFCPKCGRKLRRDENSGENTNE